MCTGSLRVRTLTQRFVCMHGRCGTQLTSAPAYRVTRQEFFESLHNGGDMHALFGGTTYRQFFPEGKKWPALRDITREWYVRNAFPTISCVEGSRETALEHSYVDGSILST